VARAADDKMKRTTLALATYWTLFVIAPVLFVFIYSANQPVLQENAWQFLLCFALSASAVFDFGKNFGNLISEKY
jgi:Sec-independent protein secretion pathway component TatC